MMPHYGSSHRRFSSLLELEAAEFFKLDLNQMNLGANKSTLRWQTSSADSSSCGGGDNGSLSKFDSSTFRPINMQVRRDRAAATSSIARSSESFAQVDKRKIARSRIESRSRQPDAGSTKRKPTNAAQQKTCADKSEDSQAAAIPARREPTRARHSLSNSGIDKRSKSPSSPRSSQRRSPNYCRVHKMNEAACSSVSSTNSLPSISSSPSVSPSLVCPHLSLDDILAFRRAPSGSPHTIGLCLRCRLDPPPNIHSPLSPRFRPHHTQACTSLASSDHWQAHDQHTGDCTMQRSNYNNNNNNHHHHHHQQQQQQQQQRHQNQNERLVHEGPMSGGLLMRRGNSDHQASSQAAHKRRQESTSSGAMAAPVRQRSDLNWRPRDDSLDYCLAPAELKRMQMSPSLRNSVEFIRRNSIESGRVVRIYKNGEPFEKPLRVCILRDEFRSLNHLLDHINSRLLVPNGARFLFHLDGQPVYSVHELKHDSVYVVSGTRHYDYRTSEVLKERQRKEQMAHANKLAGQAQQKCAGRHEVAGGRERVMLDSGDRRSALVGDKRQAVAGYTLNRDDEDEIDQASGRQKKEMNDIRASARIDQTQATKSSPMMRSRTTHAAGRVSGRECAQRARATNKFSRYDDSTGMSSAGSLNVSSQSILVSGKEDAAAAAAVDEHDPADASATAAARLTRAKSELSALPARRRAKKNVTFMDTGRGSSPAISELSSERSTKPSGQMAPVEPSQRTNGENLDAPKSTSARDLSTSEIGIQVSDSFDGYLIDLPVALPPKGSEANFSVSQRASQAGRQSKAQRGPTGAAAAAAAASKRAPKKQIVTIAERQLSLDEMNELKDLSGGDHHHEIGIQTWDGAPREGEASSELPDSPADKEAPEPEVVPDFSNTIAIGTDPNPQQVVQNARLITSAAEQGSGNSKPIARSEVTETSNWQYPGGRAASATPTERPVSQSAPSETVRARVTTPTPSLSTCGDNNSLTMSYETISAGGVGGNADKSSGGPITPTKKVARVERLRETPSELPAKRRVDVQGTLSSGTAEPARNFRLAWVNGFAINDLYPENTYSASAQDELNSRGLAGRASGGSSSPSAHLTPGYNGGGGGTPGAGIKQRTGVSQVAQVAQFKPSERYHNYICHSRKHDELIYPAGSLIVLWCRWTNEQRYYARHTSNVSALTLATLDLDLAASAQICDLNERPQIASSVHLWSLTSLSTLLVVQDDQFRSKLIFSLRLKNTRSSGCELSIAARDEKQLLLFEFNRKLAGDKSAESIERRDSAQVRAQSNGVDRQQQQQQKQQQQTSLMMKAMKPLQSNQLPLYLLRVPNLSENQQRPGGEQQKYTSACGEPIISFGRRHFDIWLGEPKQAKLRAMQCNQKSAEFSELISRANCLCRLSPGEFLVGDSDGNVALVLINCRAHEGAESSPAAPKQTKRASAPRTPPGAPDQSRQSKYSLELINLLGPKVARKNETNKAAGASAAITCLARVTGSLFMSADATRTISFWKIKRARKESKQRNSDSVPTVRLASSSLMLASRDQEIDCEQLSSISLPPDLGFICTLIMAQYNLRESLVEFYVVSTSNTILLGSVKLPSQYARPGRANVAEASGGGGGEQQQQQQQRQQVDLLANSSLSVVYEGHETAATSLVADVDARQVGRDKVPADDKHEDADQLSECQYFTCSLDCRICKWQGRRLVWKSLLPSSCASLAVHPTGFVLAVGSIDGTVYILDRISGLLISYFPLTPVRINCLAYSSDGSLLAAACANGSIFMLPVYERGLKYKKVSIFQSPHPVVSLQFSLDNRYMLTSVTRGAYQELILWDLPNFRYMRDNVKLAVDKIRWFDSICSGSEDVRAIWENANLLESVKPTGRASEGEKKTAASASPKRASQPAQRRAQAALAPSAASARRDPLVVNLSCHRLIKTRQQSAKESNADHDNDDHDDDDASEQNFVVASDTRGYLRLFRYPCYDIQQGFFAIRISSSAVNCCRFLQSQSTAASSDHFVSTSLDGSICLWTIQ